MGSFFKLFFYSSRTKDAMQCSSYTLHVLDNKPGFENDLSIYLFSADGQ
jgi:hypothetical protein